ncbi:MAG: tetratricopeptide repeat protein [Acidobacteria bacterium]|nr:tetratricopeptide repeat protein [Acidobacteriota bacterium]
MRFALLGLLILDLPGLFPRPAFGAPLSLQKASSADTFDLKHFKVDAEIDPAEYTLKSRASVTMSLVAPSRSIVLELNGSLTVSKVTDSGNKPLQFVQDRLDQLNVRIDMGEVFETGKEVTVNLDYSGALRTPEGGPVADKRLAYIGAEGCYLLYASRWLPFHNYAADLATYEINLTVPQGYLVSGYSDQMPVPKPARAGKQVYPLMSTTPVLAATLIAGKYVSKEVKTGAGLVFQFLAKPGNESKLDALLEPVGKMLEVYAARFGSFPFRERLIIAEIDNDSLDYYSSPGMICLAPRVFAGDLPVDLARLAREVAYEWWGQAVALKSFDEEWISQGLAQYSSLLYRQETKSEAEFLQDTQELLERALTFESSASLIRAPSELYDLSPSYEAVMYYKGAFVYHMLRYLMGDEKFFALLQRFYQSYRGTNAAISNFEAMASQVYGQNLRSFFGQWVDSTGVPEFRTEYLIIRTREGKFKARGTVKQNFELFNMPVELMLRSEGGTSRLTVPMKGIEAPFEFVSDTLPQEVVVDPDNHILHISEELRIHVVIRRGIEHFRVREYTEAEQQFRAALELDPASSWGHYNLGLLFFEQRNYQRALDAFNDAIGGHQRPSWTKAWSHIYRGNCYDSLGERERAVAEYQKAVETGETFNNARQMAQQYLSQPFGTPKTPPSDPK